MQDETNTQEIKDRLELIENMLSAGRRKTESWGWVFVLWGVAYYIAIAWSSWGKGMRLIGHMAWPVTMFTACLLTLVISYVTKKDEPATTMGRAIGSIWFSVGISMLLLFPSLSIANKLDQQSFVALIAIMLAIANGASGIILKWRAQIGCSAVWWTTSVAAVFCSVAQVTILFLAALTVCQIGFGIYAMTCESKRRHEAVHA